MAGRPLTRAKREQAEAAALQADPATARKQFTPRDTPADYADDLIEELLSLAAEGYSATEVAAHWAISEETFAMWEKAHKPFADAVSRARAREKAWWLARARLAIRNDNNRFPAGAWSHVMRSRFPEFDDKSGLGALLDIGALVVIQRRQPEPLHERLSDHAKPLIEGECTQLPQSLTGSGRAAANLSDADGGAVHPPGALPPAEGG